MTTKKNDSPSDPESKDDSFREAQEEGQQPADMWERLEDLGFAFKYAAVSHRREDLANVGLILLTLAEDREFRKIAHSSVRTHLSKKVGRRMHTRQEEEDFFLGTISSFMDGRSLYAEIEEKGLKSLLPGKDLLTERLPPFTEAVARLIVSLVPAYPALYGRTKGPPLTGNFLDPRAGDDDVRAIVERVREAIAPRLEDPEDAKPESVVKAALRALGVDPRYVKDMFQ